MPVWISLHILNEHVTSTHFKSINNNCIFGQNNCKTISRIYFTLSNHYCTTNMLVNCLLTHSTNTEQQFHLIKVNIFHLHSSLSLSQLMFFAKSVYWKWQLIDLCGRRDEIYETQPHSLCLYGRKKITKKKIKTHNKPRPSDLFILHTFDSMLT